MSYIDVLKNEAESLDREMKRAETRRIEELLEAAQSERKQFWIRCFQRYRVPREAQATYVRDQPARYAQSYVDRFVTVPWSDVESGVRERGHTIGGLQYRVEIEGQIRITGTTKHPDDHVSTRCEEHDCDRWSPGLPCDDMSKLVFLTVQHGRWRCNEHKTAGERLVDTLYPKTE